MEDINGKYKDITRRMPDLTKAKNLLGYEPKISMAEAIKRIIEHRRNEINRKAIKSVHSAYSVSSVYQPPKKLASLD
jgi:hypothetical protein